MICFKYNWHVGIIHQKWKFIIPFMGAIFNSFIVWLKRTTSFITAYQATPNYYDYLYEILKGCYPYNPNTKSYFELPLVYFLCFVGFLFILNNQVTQDLYEFAPVVLTRIKKRYIWLLGKYLWGGCAAAVYWIIIYSTTLAFSILMDGDIISIFDLSVEKSLVIFAVPVAVFSTIACVYITLSLIWKPIFSVVIISGCICAAAFLDNKWLLLNQMMLVRSQSFGTFQNGTTPTFTLLYSSFISITFLLLGLVKIRNMDILKKEQE